MPGTGILSWPRSGGYIFLILFPAQLILNTGCSETTTANRADVFNCQTLDDALHYEAWFLNAVENVMIYKLIYTLIVLKENLRATSFCQQSLLNSQEILSQVLR